MKRMKYAAVLLCLLVFAALLTGCGVKTAGEEEYIACLSLSGDLGKKQKISGPLTLDFTGDDNAQQKFNRFALEYSLSAPVRGVARYEGKNGPVEEEFFLSETKESFSQLVDGVLDGAQAKRLESITVTPLKEGPCRFQLKKLSLAMQEVPEKVITIENDRYKLGVKLAWGGGISSLVDKASPRSDLENLLNCHDTGRLIQQSFYGVMEHPDYKNGFYGKVKWPYNPVQGGDLHGNSSKIVAVEQQKDRITIVSRSLDWAKNNRLTDTYYTNTYTLDGDLVRVDNSMIDFSGFPHPVTTQEIPAFYTVSALNSFVFYDGEQPWSGDELSYRRDLGFWANDPACQMALSPKNTERWCAWVDDSNYGVGLYTPGADCLKAGRYKYDGSVKALSDSTNYVAPLVTTRLPDCTPLSYSYLLCAGTVEEIRGAFLAEKDFTDNEELRYSMDKSFDFSAVSFAEESRLEFLSAPGQTQIGWADGCAVLKANPANPPDPFVHLRYAFNQEELFAEEYPFVVVTYRVDENNSKRAESMELFLSTDRLSQAAGGHSLVQKLETDGEFHAAVIPVQETGFWNGRINQIRLDYFTNAEKDDTFYLYSVDLAKDRKEADRIAENRLKAAQDARH